MWSSLLLFWGALGVGYGARRLHLVPPSFAAPCIRWLASFVAPPVILFAMWVVDLKHLALVSLPFVGLAVSGASLLPAWWLARRWQLPSSQRGSWLVSAFFSNVGFLGALIAFVVWGEGAYGLCQLFFLFFGPAVYTVGYGLAGRYAPRPDTAAPRRVELWRWAPMVGTLVGLALSWWEVPRPGFLTTVNRALIPWMTAIYLFTIGTMVHVSRVGRDVRPALWMCGIKLLYAPLVGAGLAWLLHYHTLQEGLVFRVVVLESAMPPALTSLTLTTLFALDQDFANSLWIVGAVLSMAVVPVVLWLL